MLAARGREEDRRPHQRGRLRGQRAAGAGAPGATASPSTTKALEAPVKVSAEETNNALIVTASAHDYAAVREVIRRLDQPRRQVYIEAVVMDLSVQRSNALESAFHGFAGISPGIVGLRRLEPDEVAAAAHGLELAAGAGAGRAGPERPGAGVPARNAGHDLDPGARLLPRRATPPRPTRTSCRRRTSWRPTTPRRSCTCSSTRRCSATSASYGAPSSGAAGSLRGFGAVVVLGSRVAELRKDRPQDQGHAAPRRLRRGAPRRDRDDLGPRGRPTARSAPSTSPSAVRPRR